MSPIDFTGWILRPSQLKQITDLEAEVDRLRAQLADINTLIFEDHAVDELLDKIADILLRTGAAPPEEEK